MSQNVPDTDDNSHEQEAGPVLESSSAGPTPSTASSGRVPLEEDDESKRFDFAFASRSTMKECLGIQSGRVKDVNSEEETTATQFKQKWVEQVEKEGTGEVDDGLSEALPIPEKKDKRGIFTRRRFAKGEFILEYKGGLNQNWKRARIQGPKPKWQVIRGVTTSDETPYNLNVNALDLESGLKIFFTARSDIQEGAEVVFNQSELTEKLRVLRKKNRATFRLSSSYGNTADVTKN